MPTRALAILGSVLTGLAGGVAVIGCAGAGSEPAAWPAPRVGPETPPDDLGPRLAELCTSRGVPGLAAALVRGGRIEAIGVAGVRSLGGDDPIRVDDRFHIASCTKSMTAMVAASLVEQGTLSWSTTIEQAMPDLAGAGRPEYRPVTLQLLLAHGGRLPAYTRPSRERAAHLLALPGTPRQQRELFVGEVLSEEPNTGHGDSAYSNAGYAVAAVMIERASNDSWENLVRDRVLVPLGMRTAAFGWPATPEHPDQPRGHYHQESGLRTQPLDDEYRLAPCLWPAGAVNCSIEDLARYAADHLNGLVGRPALLRPATCKVLHRTIDGSDSGFTLGWGVRRDAALGTVHYGAGSGGTFFVRIAIAPEHDAAVVVASNSGNAGAATREVIDTLLAPLAGRPAKSP